MNNLTKLVKEVYDMQIKGFPLIKFQSEERITSLQDGLIYMNSLEWFRKHENANGDTVVGDSYEALLHMNEGKIILPDTGEELEIHNENIKTSVSNDYAYCMFSINPCVNNFSFTTEQIENIKSFGDTALLILDIDEFLSRIRNAALKEGYEIHFGFVRYYDDTIDSADVIISLLSGMHNIAFWKRKMYEYQQEYRFLIHTKDFTKDHLELNIGDIRDISKVIKASQLLNAKLKKL